MLKNNMHICSKGEAPSGIQMIQEARSIHHPFFSISLNEQTYRTGLECGPEGLSGNEQVQQCLACLQWLLVDHQCFDSEVETHRN